MQTELISLRLRQRRRQNGFTLIEIMVVVVIMGIMAAMLVPKVIQRAADARITATKTNITEVINALKMYKLDNSRYPTAEQGLQALITKPTTGPIPSNWKEGGYIDKTPKDTWGKPLLYLAPGLHGEVDVWSLGADGVQGGTGEDADIGSWEIQ
ncbi:MAG: type II secretion system major pseudopilin GspG [Burkholderiales bacterium]|nr:type II secretion system major pseudopilin GspG [Burkholderiales bacterium]